MTRTRKNIKAIAFFLMIDMCISIIIPSVNASYALTSGPSSPEFSSFEPVATTNMVDPFTGNFTYNLPVIQIPGPDGGGYAMSLSYHSGTSSEEDASWVGHGWTLNPGAINVGVRGYPDEYNGEKVERYNKNRPNWTMAGTAKANLEFFSKSEPQAVPPANPPQSSDTTRTSSQQSFTSLLNLSLSKNIRYNNYQGLAKTLSFGLAANFGSLSMNRSATGITYSANVNPFGILNGPKKETIVTTNTLYKKGNTDVEETERITKNSTTNYSKSNGFKGSLASTAIGTFFNSYSFTDLGQQTTLGKLRGYNFNLSFGGQVNPALLPIGFEGGLIGAFSLNFEKPYDEVDVYGYNHNYDPNGGKSTNFRSDYLVEKGQAFDKRDVFIGIPFSTPDSYLLTGEGLSGGFRPFRKQVGSYFPELISGADNRIQTFGLGFEIMVGTNIGVGVSLAFGNTESSIKDWKRTNNTNDPNFSFYDNPTDSVFYRFNGDMGSKIEYGDNNLTLARLTPSPIFPGLVGVTPSLNSAEISDLSSDDDNVSTYVEPTQNETFKIYNDNGLKYAYTQAVKNRNTTNLSTDVGQGTIDNNYIAYNDLNLNSEYKADFEPHEILIGENIKKAYTNTHLLDSILTPDYIDIGNDGCDEKDFGGWTYFRYHKKAGDTNDVGSNDWFRWRMPYTGLLYTKNSISDVKDDMGTVSTGEKEVYYLKQIETKTHVAYFVTNKSNFQRFDNVDPASIDFLEGSKNENGEFLSRLDGLEAPGFSADGKDLAANNPNEKGVEKLEYLEKVVLFSKARPDVPLQITNFQYDYSLVPNVPNNINSLVNGNPTNYDDSGKLTLRRVWSEFEGVYNARTSSYKFEYRYKDKNDYPDYLYQDRPSLTNFFDLSDKYSVNAQNPTYNPHRLDAWSYNQYDGENRHLRMIKWPYQGDISNASNYDPAAWQLKQIKLPSGGEILVEYESKDYLYVQDRLAQGIIKLKDFNDQGQFPSYTLDLSDIGISEDDISSKSALIDVLRDHFISEIILDENNEELVDPANRIYFKFLYALEGNSPSLENCKSEYITGYSLVKSIDLVNDEVVITLNGESSGENLIGFGLTPIPQPDPDYNLTPRQGCYDFYVTQRWGKFTAGCEGEFEKKYENNIIELADNKRNDDNLVQSFGDLVDIFGFTATAITTLVDGSTNKSYPTKNEVCLTLNPELSYIKIPINKAKRGGGIRVKRLLMYDSGIENGDAAIYGQEYKYILENGQSSGVASNEPAAMREENALVDFIPKRDQTWLSRLVIGKDKEQSEGPIGETLLPSASVGHSRVVMENIHKGQTGTGYVVSEFFTCKDYPFDKVYDYRFANEDPVASQNFEIGQDKPAKGVGYSVLQDNSYDDNLSIPTPNFQYSLDKAWASQGYRFILNDMHGKPKSTRTYGGDYASGDNSFISSGQDYYYYEPGEQILMLKEDGTAFKDIPGKEMDLTMEKYRINNQNLNFDFEIDVSVGLILPPPIFGTGNLRFSYSEQQLSKYAISKVIRYPVIQKKIVTYSDNIASTMENLAFDAYTGSSILTKTYDAYHNIPLFESEELHDGSIYNFMIPGHWNYSQLGKKSENTNHSNQLKTTTGQIISYGKNANPIDSNTAWSIKQDRILSASANTMTTWSNINSNFNNDETKLDELHALYNSASSQNKLDRILRPYQSFIFKSDTKKSSDRITSNGKIFEGGVLEAFVPFDYQASDQDTQWVKTNQASLYSPFGNVLEEQNVLGVFSAAKFGYNQTQPVIVSQNAQFSDIYFEHFEDKYNQTGLALIENIAHSGSFSLSISQNESVLNLSNPSAQLSDEGGWLKFWVASSSPLTKVNISLPDRVYESEFVAKTGEWSLYRTFIEPESFEGISNFNPTISWESGTISSIYIDDIKFQPKEAQSSCYVYDVKSLRLITVLDDQHFGLFYIYNNEGKLVRKMIESERGMKILNETQYNVPSEYN